MREPLGTPRGRGQLSGEGRSPGPGSSQPDPEPSCRASPRGEQGAGHALANPQAPGPVSASPLDFGVRPPASRTLGWPGGGGQPVGGLRTLCFPPASCVRTRADAGRRFRPRSHAGVPAVPAACPAFSRMLSLLRSLSPRPVFVRSIRGSVGLWRLEENPTMLLLRDGGSELSLTTSLELVTPPSACPSSLSPASASSQLTPSPPCSDLLVPILRASLHLGRPTLPQARHSLK